MRTVSTAVLTLIFLTPCTLMGIQDDPPSGVSLHMAALTGNVEAVRRHIAAGSDLNAKDPYGSTPLIIAATFDRPQVARALMEAGADLELTNNDGATALHTAAFLCRSGIVQDLLDHGARKYTRDGAGNTPAEALLMPFEEVRPVYETIRE